MPDEISIALDHVAASEYFREAWESQNEAQQRQILIGLATVAMFNPDSWPIVQLISLFQSLNPEFAEMSRDVVNELWKANEIALQFKELFRARCLSDPVIKAHSKEIADEMRANGS